LIVCVVVLIFVGLGLASRRSSTQQAPAAPANRISNTAAPPRPTALAAAAQATQAPQPAPSTEPVAAKPAAPAPFFDSSRFSYEPGFYSQQIQAFLDSQPSPLKSMVFQVGDRRHSFAEVLIGRDSYSSINPKVILALLEQQSHLLSTATPSADQVGWALGYQGENGKWRGLQAQIRWAVRQIVRGKNDYPQYLPLTYADNSSTPPPAGMSMSEYAIARVLAPTTTPDQLPRLLQGFLETYTRLFGDPRQPPADWPAPASPFLTRPSERTAPVTSFFDHDAPFLIRSGSLTTYWGRNETDIGFAYDGHDGWDYALAPPDMALAAADGDVVFAGNADDNCATRAVIIDHGNGYRTLYWHLDRVDAQIGQHVARGQPIGMIGSSGCAFGPHLHFGVQYLGRSTDPYGWCGPEPDPWQQNPSGNISTWLWMDRPSPCLPPPVGAVVVDTDSPGFAKDGDGWQSTTVGYGGGALFVPSTRGADTSAPWELRPLIRPAVAVWQPALPAAGRYRVLAYVPYALSGMEDAQRVRYHIHYAGGEAEITVDGLQYRNDWVELGTYEFDPNDHPAVSISNIVEDNQLSVWADAVIWLPVDSP
jgi:murein DD-endopeptidase MepM/ murein hydrolase activator NlpD